MHVEHETEVGPLTLEARVGRELRRAREDRGWTQRETATRIAALPGYESWHQTTVARIESAKRPLRLNELEMLASLFGVPLETLIGGGAETFDAEIKEVERRLAETHAKHQETWARLGEIEAEEAGLQAERDTLSGQVGWLQATLESLRRARGNLESQR
jgi:transcriptional regulator with XRE-family HTH domain